MPVQEMEIIWLWRSASVRGLLHADLTSKIVSFVLNSKSWEYQSGNTLNASRSRLRLAGAMIVVERQPLLYHQTPYTRHKTQRPGHVFLSLMLHMLLA